MQSGLKVITFWNWFSALYFMKCGQILKCCTFGLNVELTIVHFELYTKVNIVQKLPRLGRTDCLEDTAPKRPLVSPSRPASTPTFYGLSANRYCSKFIKIGIFL